MARNDSPKYARQKRRGKHDLAYVALDGQRIYLGRYGTKSSREWYHRIMAEYAASGRVPSTVPADEVTIAELIEAYWQYAERYYVKPDGSPTSSQLRIKAALRPTRRLYGSEKAAEFGPNALRAVRQTWVLDGLSRSTANAYAGIIKAVFKWAAAQEMIPAATYHAVATVEGLRRGRSAVKESEPVRPVPEAHIDAIQPHVSRQVWGLIQLQLHTGARPGELVGLRAVDLDTSGTVWTYTPADHKTAHHGHHRTIYFGPKAQQVIEPFLAGRPIDAALFDPREAERERKAKGFPRMKGRRQANARRPDQRPGPKTTDRIVGEAYTTGSYGRAVERACALASVPRWSPNRLRHNAATMLRKEHGIEVAQTILGHRLGSAITEVYAEANVTKAMGVIGKIG